MEGWTRAKKGRKPFPNKYPNIHEGTLKGGRADKLLGQVLNRRGEKLPIAGCGRAGTCDRTVGHYDDEQLDELNRILGMERGVSIEPDGSRRLTYAVADRLYFPRRQHNDGRHTKALVRQKLLRPEKRRVLIDNKGGASWQTCWTVSERELQSHQGNRAMAAGTPKRRTVVDKPWRDKLGCEWLTTALAEKVTGIRGATLWYRSGIERKRIIPRPGPRAKTKLVGWRADQCRAFASRHNRIAPTRRPRPRPAAQRDAKMLAYADDLGGKHVSAAVRDWWNALPLAERVATGMPATLPPGKAGTGIVRHALLAARRDKQGGKPQ